MNRFKTSAAALAVLLIGGTSAQAACQMSTVGNKDWIMSATDVGTVHKYLMYCGFKASAAGTISLTPSGCAINTASDPDFQTPARIDLVSGSFTKVAGKLCAFDLTLSFGAPFTMNARIVFETGKSTASGNWVSTFGSYGSVTLARQ